MDATEHSDDRVAEIQKAVGNPFTMSPEEYSAKLKHETGSDEILEQFLEKACKLDREMTPYPAEEWLKRLTTMDFRNAAAISKHHFALTLYRKGDVSPSHPDPEPSKTDTATTSGKSLPSLVMPIGQLQKKSMEEDDDDYVDTDYFLAIDATKTNHPVWLIYDRNPRHDLGERHIVDPDKQPLVFKELGKNFDAMLVFPSLRWWLIHYEKPDFAHMLKVMQATGITGPIQAKGLALSEADKLVSK
ncbi:hypothetical protein H9Q74_004649 [Fusarium xylarioides]|nr:hypothetical protein H9Q71_004816 [Fusarium xylarioides]KAG5825267.1 hypothetical protein H9Q74_004649 [Fusarium xylarioides]